MGAAAHDGGRPRVRPRVADGRRHVGARRRRPLGAPRTMKRRALRRQHALRRRDRGRQDRGRDPLRRAGQHLGRQRARRRRARGRRTPRSTRWSTEYVDRVRRRGRAAPGRRTAHDSLRYGARSSSACGTSSRPAASPRSPRVRGPRRRCGSCPGSPCSASWPTATASAPRATGRPRCSCAPPP